MRSRSGGIASAFGARAAAAFALSAYLWHRPLSWGGVFRAGAWYAVVDGCLGVASAALLARDRDKRTSSLLTTMTVADALLRIAVGALVLALPALVDIPMTVVPLFGTIGIYAVALGLSALALWIVQRHRHQAPHGWQHAWREALFDPILVIALLSIGVGAVLFVSPPSSDAFLQRMLAIGGLIVGTSFSIACAGAAPANLHSGAPNGGPRSA
jgi:hypothetical protein